MKKWFKKTVAVVLTAAVALTATVPAFATAESNSVSENKIMVMQEPGTLDSSVVGLDQYLSYNEDQTIAFDEAAALAAGYKETAVTFVRENITKMNQMVLAGTAVPCGDFKVTTHTISLFTVSESVIVYEWNGYINYYLNLRDSKAFYQCLKVGYTIGQAASDALALVDYSHVLSSMGAIGTLYSTLMKSQVEMAYALGTGLLMMTQIQPETGAMFVGFTYQDN